MAPQGAAHGASAQNNPGPACSFHLWRLVYLPAEVGRSIIRFDVDGHWDREIGSLGPTHAALAGRDLLDAPRPAGRRASRGWHGGTLHCTPLQAIRLAPCWLSGQWNWSRGRAFSRRVAEKVHEKGERTRRGNGRRFGHFGHFARAGSVPARCRGRNRNRSSS